MGDLGSSRASALTGCVTSRKLPTLSKPCLPHLKNMHILLTTHCQSNKMNMCYCTAHALFTYP